MGSNPGYLLKYFLLYQASDSRKEWEIETKTEIRKFYLGYHINNDIIVLFLFWSQNLMIKYVNVTKDWTDYSGQCTSWIESQM